MKSHYLLDLAATEFTRLSPPFVAVSWIMSIINFAWKKSGCDSVKDEKCGEKEKSNHFDGIAPTYFLHTAM